MDHNKNYSFLKKLEQYGMQVQESGYHALLTFNVGIIVAVFFLFFIIMSNDHYLILLF